MPIIQSLLDTDFYKFTMGQTVFHRYPSVSVCYALKNRTTTILLADVIDETRLRYGLDCAKELKLTAREISYLRSINRSDGKQMFGDEYLKFLSEISLPDYVLCVANGQFELEFPGPWQTAIYWETLALSIINKLYYETLLNRMTSADGIAVFKVGNRRLNEKIATLLEMPDIKFIEFGTRRRFSRLWQEKVTRTLAKKTPNNLVGTSNVWLAMKYGLKPIGTMAHEMFMVCAALASGDDELRSSHNKVIADWEAEYAPDLLVALTDTFGTDFFFRDMTREQAERWRGLRQDSGDPIAFGEKAIAFYQSHSIDPAAKTLIFSDGLDIGVIKKIADHFRGQTNLLFGWGTNLTNDLGLKSLSLVVKAAKANSTGTVKLSDNLAKAMGAPEDISRYKRVFIHTTDLYEACRY